MSFNNRGWNLFDSTSKEPFRLSRTKIDLFLECPRCFYLDRKLGVKRPGMPAFSLNSAVDCLLKKEFDLLRKKGESHELMKKYGIDAVPYNHPDLPEWRDDFYKYIGACVLHEKTNFEVCGIVDDIWANEKEELFIVDYKSTSTKKEISLDDEYKEGYKKQMEVYQWIFRQKGFKVSNIGYFVFANATKNRSKFDGKLEFKSTIISYKGNDFWIERTLIDAKKCLMASEIPDSSPTCEHCAYTENRKEAER
ncbi:MAG: PD-(D/E)XK nuclease family protein [Candidatus Pacebacteria bacterium]|nr:PD-(D/E)XK nuclease family protein [Candidatus Paceibacterota bacterium]